MSRAELSRAEMWELAEMSRAEMTPSDNGILRRTRDNIAYHYNTLINAGSSVHDMLSRAITLFYYKFDKLFVKKVD